MEPENICEKCGGQIDLDTMECPYCGTRYRKRVKIKVGPEGLSIENDRHEPILEFKCDGLICNKINAAEIVGGILTEEQKRRIEA